jgi:hypothetical protein
MCRKLAFVNRRGAKKPKANEVCFWKALGKATAEEVGEADSPEGFGLIQWQGQTFKRSENGSPQKYLYSNLKFANLLI